jgi:hypothetical protein
VRFFGENFGEVIRGDVRGEENLLAALEQSGQRGEEKPIVFAMK